MEGLKSPIRKSPNRQQRQLSPSRETLGEEERLILLHNRNDPMSNSFSSSSSAPTDSKPDLIVKVQSDPDPKLSPKIWRDSSYDFRNDVVGPPIRRGGRDRTNNNNNNNSTSTSSSDDDSVEFDFQKHKGKSQEEAEDQGDLESQNLSPVSENDYGKLTPKDTRVFFKDADLVHRRPPDQPNSRAAGVISSSGQEGEVVTCSANSSFQRKSTLLTKTKTKSRLMDPPPERYDGNGNGNVERSGRIKRSGHLGNTKNAATDDNNNYDDDDPFLNDDDLPEEYKKTNFSFFGLVQILSLILITALLVCSLVIPYFKGKTIWGMQLWKWEVMLLVLICGGLVSGWLIRLVVFFIERNFLLRKRVLYFVYGLRSAVQNCLWLGWVLLAWNLILDKKVEKETHSKYLPYVTKILVCLLVATFFWLFKTLLVKVLAMSFHVNAFFDRIQETLFDQYVIETLSGPPLIELRRIQDDEDRAMSELQKLQNAGANIPADLRANCMPEKNNNKAATGSARSTVSGLQKSPLIGKSPRFSTDEQGGGGGGGGVSIDLLHRLNHKNISAWNMKRLMNTVRKGVLSTLDEQLVDSGLEDETSMQIRSEKQAKAAAKRIFNNVARPGSKHIQLEDFMRFMREDEAIKAMRHLEASTDSKGISKRVLKNWVVNVFRERRALALSLNDTKTAVNKLHQLLNVLVGFGIVIIWLMILGVPITHFLVFISSQLLLLTFMFGNTFKTTFEAIIFLFVMHPYDVGDRCEIDGVQMIVEEMNILTTVFLRYDNQKIIYPNSVLATQPISNYYRSPHMGDAIDFCVHISTSVEKISLMKERITRYIENKSDHWYPAPMIVMRDVEDMNRIKFSVWLSHTMNHQDMGERWVRRARLVEEMVSIFRELDIEYRMLPLELNVRSLPSWTSDRLPSNWITCAK